MTATGLDILFPKSALDALLATLSPDQLSKHLEAQHLWNDNNTISLFNYTNPLIKNMIWAMKFKDNKRVTKLFASAVSDFLIEECSDRALFEAQENPIIIPIPLYKKRYRERGYNQSARVARNICEHNDTFSFHDNILIRTKHTPPQTSLKSKTARIQNVRDVFDIADSEHVQGQHIILLDDITTTGSTLREARETLLTAGAKNVLCIALAH